MSSQEVSDRNLLPDLIVNECLFGCEGCPVVWTNRQIGHKILCRCACGHDRIKNNRHENMYLQGPRIRTPKTHADIAKPPVLADAHTTSLMNTVHDEGDQEVLADNEEL